MTVLTLVRYKSANQFTKTYWYKTQHQKLWSSNYSSAMTSMTATLAVRRIKLHGWTEELSETRCRGKSISTWRASASTWSNRSSTCLTNSSNRTPAIYKSTTTTSRTSQGGTSSRSCWATANRDQPMTTTPPPASMRSWTTTKSSTMSCSRTMSANTAHRSSWTTATSTNTPVSSTSTTKRQKEIWTCPLTSKSDGMPIVIETSCSSRRRRTLSLSACSRSNILVS